MRTSRIIPAAFVASALSGPAHAAPTCLLEVAGQRYIDGPCDAFRTTAALPWPRSALLSWTPISTTSRLRRCSKERAGGRSATSRASFLNSESLLTERHAADIAQLLFRSGSE